MNKATCAALLLGAMLATGPTAFAAGSAERQVAVKIGDLNLQSAAGRRELEHRLTRAARKVCPDPYSRSVQTAMTARACVERAVGQALGQVRQRQLAGAPPLGSDRS